MELFLNISFAMGVHRSGSCGLSLAVIVVSGALLAFNNICDHLDKAGGNGGEGISTIPACTGCLETDLVSTEAVWGFETWLPLENVIAIGGSDVWILPDVELGMSIWGTGKLVGTFSLTGGLKKQK